MKDTSSRVSDKQYSNEYCRIILHSKNVAHAVVSVAALLLTMDSIFVYHHSIDKVNYRMQMNRSMTVDGHHPNWLTYDRMCPTMISIDDAVHRTDSMFSNENENSC
jgi:hypothetical protein